MKDESKNEWYDIPTADEGNDIDQAATWFTRTLAAFAQMTRRNLIEFLKPGSTTRKYARFDQTVDGDQVLEHYKKLAKNHPENETIQETLREYMRVHGYSE